MPITSSMHFNFLESTPLRLRHPNPSTFGTCRAPRRRRSATDLFEWLQRWKNMKKSTSSCSSLRNQKCSVQNWSFYIVESKESTAFDQKTIFFLKQGAAVYGLVERKCSRKEKASMNNNAILCPHQLKTTKLGEPKRMKRERNVKKQSWDTLCLPKRYKICSFWVYLRFIMDWCWLYGHFLNLWCCQLGFIVEVYHISKGFGFENFETSKFAAWKVYCGFQGFTALPLRARFILCTLDSSTVSGCFWIIHWSCLFCGFVSNWRWTGL